MLKDEELILFEKRKLFENEWHIRDINKPHNISTPDEDIYISKTFEIKNCTFYDTIDLGSHFNLLLVVVIPIAFFITVIGLIVTCWKYKSKVNEYNALQNRGDQDVSGNNN